MTPPKRQSRDSREPIQASQLESQEVEWLPVEGLDQRMPKGMLIVIAGKRDQGKGLFSAYMAAQVSRSGGNVLYSAAEDDAAMITRPRLEAAGADLSRVLLWRFRVPEAMRQLEKRIVENDIRLVVMDPFASHLSGGISRHSDNVRVVTDPIGEIAAETGCTFVVVDHTLKRLTKNMDPLDAIGGQGLPAASRAAYLFGSDPKDRDRKLLCNVKMNVGQRPKAVAFEVDTSELDVGEIPYLLYQEETDVEANILFTAAEEGTPGRPPDRRRAAAEWLSKLLFDKGKPVKAGAVFEDAKQYGLSAKTVRRAADDMGVVRKPPGGGRNCTWELPDEVIEAMKQAGATPAEDD